MSVKAKVPKPRIPKAPCDLCVVTCSSKNQLLEHVLGQKHRRLAVQRDPTCAPHLEKLQYFLDTHLMQDPVLGLEYVEEIQKENGYKYRCELCNFSGDRKLAYLHITCCEHTAVYINRHHPDLSVFRRMYAHITDYVTAVEEVAAKVCEIYGRKKVKEIVPDGADAPPPPRKETKTKTAAAVPKGKSGSHTKSRQRPERTDDRCQVEASGFKGNGDFLDYLQKFEIRSDEDARLIKQILQNCTQALWRFQQEEARQSDPRGKVPGGPSASANRTGEGASVVNSAPTSQADVTELFFSSIKTMEEAEVRDLLQQIAATNAAFRGINVPNVLRYLQATGRLKTS